MQKLSKYGTIEWFYKLDMNIWNFHLVVKELLIKYSKNGGYFFKTFRYLLFYAHNSFR